MIPITQPLLETFAPYRSVCSLNDVVVKDVWAVNNAYQILKKMGLPVSKKVIVNNYRLWLGYHIFSYDFLEIGPEERIMKHNIATLGTTFNMLHIHFFNPKTHVGRGHGLPVPQWHEVFDPT